MPSQLFDPVHTASTNPASRVEATVASTWLTASRQPADDDLLRWPADMFAFHLRRDANGPRSARRYGRRRLRPLRGNGPTGPSWDRATHPTSSVESGMSYAAPSTRHSARSSQAARGGCVKRC